MNKCEWLIKKITKKELEKLYKVRNKTIKDISKIFNVSNATIWKKLKKYNIETRRYGSWRVWNKGLDKNDKKVLEVSNKVSKKLKLLYASGKVKPWNKGLTKETDKRVADCVSKLSEIRKVIFKGEGNPFYGKKHSKETKSKLSLVHGGTGVPYENSRAYSEEFNEALREEIRKRDNYTCQICNRTQEENISIYGRKLDVHHIDYNKKNSNKSNLIALCGRCHRRTNYKRNYWIEYFTQQLINI